MLIYSRDSNFCGDSRKNWNKITEGRGAKYQFKYLWFSVSRRSPLFLVENFLVQNHIGGNSQWSMSTNFTPVQATPGRDSHSWPCHELFIPQFSSSEQRPIPPCPFPWFDLTENDCIFRGDYESFLPLLSLAALFLAYHEHAPHAFLVLLSSPISLKTRRPFAFAQTCFFKSSFFAIYKVLYQTRD